MLISGCGLDCFGERGTHFQPIIGILDRRLRYAQQSGVLCRRAAEET
jgi:hypothetical protein